MPSTNRTANLAAQTVTVAFAIGWLFDLLFWGKLPGVAVVLFVGALIAALVMLGRAGEVVPARRNLWLIAPLLFFASMIGVRANGFVIFQDVVACLVLLTLVAYFYAAGRVDRISLIGYLFSLVDASFNALYRAAPLVPAAVRASRIKGVSGQGARKMLPVLRGLIIALPVAFVFVLLLASADVVFAGYVVAALRLDYLPDVQAFLWQAALALFVTWIVAGGLALALTRRDSEDNEPWERLAEGLPRAIRMGFTESVTVLVVVDLIFLLFGWIQLVYLFGGRANITVEGFTYADYARRGFFELIAVSVLTMGLVLSLHWLTWRETWRQALIFRLVATLAVGLTLVLLASAFYRMALYEDAYGYTHLRLYAHLFEIWLALLFGWLLVTLWLKPRSFAIGCFLAAMGFLATINVVNPDAMIAEENLARYQATGKIDISYLFNLSEDGIPTLLDDADKLNGDDRERLLFSLKWKLQRMKQDSGWRELPSLNAARWQAYDALFRNEKILAQATWPGQVLEPTNDPSAIDSNAWPVDP